MILIKVEHRYILSQQFKSYLYIQEKYLHIFTARYIQYKKYSLQLHLNNRKLKTTQTPMNRRTNKYIIVSSDSGIQYYNMNEQTTTITIIWIYCINMALGVRSQMQKSTHYLITFYNIWKQIKLMYSVRSLDGGYPLKEEVPRRGDKSGCSEMLFMLHLLIWILVI